MTSKPQRGKKQKRKHHAHHGETSGNWANAIANWPTLTEAVTVTDRTGTPPRRLSRKGRHKHIESA